MGEKTGNIGNGVKEKFLSKTSRCEEWFVFLTKVDWDYKAISINLSSRQFRPAESHSKNTFTV